MIVLRIDVRGHSADVRWAGAEAVLGSGPASGIQRDDAGWAPREAVLVHVGTEVLLVRADGRGQWPLRIGDSATLGEATLTLVGLLPLPVDAPQRESGFQIAPEPAPTTAAAMAAAHVQTPASTPTPATPPPRVQRWRVSTFEDELAAALKRSPWFAVSLAFHVIVILALMLLVPDQAPTARADSVYGVTSATLPNDDPTVSGGTPDAADPEQPPEEYVAPSIDEPSPEHPPTPDDAPRTVPESMPVPDAGLDDAPPPAFVGPSHGALTARVTSRRSPSSPTPVSADEVVYEGEHLAQDARKRAAARVKAAVVKGGGALGRALKGLHTEDILVIRGSFDHMEVVLEELGVPFTLRSPFELAEGYDFKKHKLVFWNCGDWVLPPRFREPVLKAIREFVHEGGYLFTTDWAVGTVVAPAFPGYLDTSGGRRTLEELVLEVRPVATMTNHLLLDGVFDESAQAKWWLESASFDVIVRDPSKVEVLVEAPRLAERPYGRSSVIAATFTYGRGRVLHVMGHYDQQKGNLAGTVGVQRMPLNFVRMRLDRSAPVSPER